MRRLRLLPILMHVAGGLAVSLAPGIASAAESGAVDFGTTTASAATRTLANRILASGDTHGLPFVIVDKAEAHAFAFDASGALRGSAPVLLGLARGDVSPPGIGNRKLADITPAERITPAGRFAAVLGHDLTHDVLWVDYDAAIALHRVVPGTVAEHRLARLASASPLDHRISYGCINVPPTFYEGVVLPLFQPANGIVYVLPETTSLDAVFGSMGRPQGPLR